MSQVTSNPASSQDASEQTPVQQNQGASNSPAKVRLDESSMNTIYANFCRVTGTPEEMLIDFGINAQPTSQSGDQVALSQRVVMNFYTAKRMLAALNMAIQRHEAIFGELETNIQKRAKPTAATSQNS